MVVTVSESNRVIQTEQLDQVMDQVTAPSYKWFSLADNTLDGSYHLFGDTLQVGWWGASLSGAGGVFASPPVLTITETRSVSALRVVGDSLLNDFPVDFTVKLYNSTALLHTETVVGNAVVNWTKNLMANFDVTSIVITVSKINKVARVVKLVDAFSPFEIIRSDTLKPKLTDTVSIALGILSSDTILVVGSEAKTLGVQVTRTDILKPKITEVSLFTLYEMWRSDTLKPKITEESIVGASFTRTDDLLPKITEAIIMDVATSSLDSLLIKGTIEEDLITADFSSLDNLVVKATEEVLMTNVHTRMNDNFRQTFAKIEITYTDPFIDNTISIAANSTAFNTDPLELADNVMTPAYKWFSLCDNKLDGTSHLLGSQYSIGWWSEVLSDGAGEFVVNPTIEVTFEPRPLYKLKVVGDSLLDSYPVDFTIECYDSALVYTETVVGNTDVSWTKDIAVLHNITRMVLTISKINKAYNTARLTEFFTSVVETYYNDAIVSLSMLEELEYPNGSVALGSVSSNEIDIALDNSTGTFNFGNDQSPLYNLVKRNRRVRAWLGVEIIPDIIEWYPLGVFWTIGWNIVEDSLEALATARDRLDVLKATDFTISEVYENYTLYQLFVIVLDDAGLLSADYVLDEALSDITIPYAWFDRISHREAIQRLAQCAYIQVYCNRTGQIVVGAIDTSSQVYTSFDGDTNIYKKSFPIVFSSVTNYVEVSPSPFIEKALEDVLKVTEVIVVPANSSLDASYSFNQIPVKNVQEPVLTGGAGLTVSTIPYAWGVAMTFTNDTSSDVSVTGIIVQGQGLEVSGKSYAIAKDASLINDNGKLKVSVAHDFIQTTAYAQTLATTLLNAYKQSLYDVSMQAKGDIGLAIGQKIQVNDIKMNTAYQYTTQRQAIEWNGALGATIDGKRI
jgi:hypothetical protein